MEATKVLPNLLMVGLSQLFLVTIFLELPSGQAWFMGPTQPNHLAIYMNRWICFQQTLNVRLAPKSNERKTHRGALLSRDVRVHHHAEG